MHLHARMVGSMWGTWRCAAQVVMQQGRAEGGAGVVLSRKGLPPFPSPAAAATAFNGAAASIAPVPPTTATPAPDSDLGVLALAALFPGVLDACLRLLAAMLEFNATNQKLARFASTDRTPCQSN